VSAAVTGKKKEAIDQGGYPLWLYCFIYKRKTEKVLMGI
jgi:hypothetical protein